MYLLDTMVVSDFAKRRPNPAVAGWAASVPLDQLFVSVLTIGEIEYGAARQKASNPAFFRQMSAWVEGLLRLYAERVLPLTVPIARAWGRLGGRLGHKSIDLAIAATALENGFIVVTRNIKHFTPTRVRTLNPFK